MRWIGLQLAAWYEWISKRNTVSPVRQASGILTSWCPVTRGKDPLVLHATKLQHSQSGTPILPPVFLSSHVRAHNSVTREHKRSTPPVNQAYYEFILLSAVQKQSALLAAGVTFIHTNQTSICCLASVSYTAAVYTELRQFNLWTKTPQWYHNSIYLSEKCNTGNKTNSEVLRSVTLALAFDMKLQRLAFKKDLDKGETVHKTQHA